MSTNGASKAIHVTLPARVLRGSVTERLSARLDALEPVVQRLLANEAKLIADSLAAQRMIADLYTECERMERELHERDLRLAMLLPYSRGLWARLRWLVTGRSG